MARAAGISCSVALGAAILGHAAKQIAARNRTAQLPQLASDAAKNGVN